MSFQFSSSNISPLFVSSNVTNTTFLGTNTTKLTCSRRVRNPYKTIHYKTPRMIAQQDNLGLTPTLRKYVDGFSMVPDQKLRYQQLLFLAQKLPSMDSSLKTDENRVRGCTSVVHVHVSLDNDRLVRLQGDSDAQLTKGLLALLVDGLDGAPPEAVAAVDPQFISSSGLSKSLTPSRNNGFINMLIKIKNDVAKLVDEADDKNVVTENSTNGQDDQSDLVGDPDRPMYSALIQKLGLLKPTILEIVDRSAEHRGHAGAKGLDGESHFSVYIVSKEFDALGLVQRHRLIYKLMNDEMSAGYIHALEISAFTPDEHIEKSSKQ